MKSRRQSVSEDRQTILGRQTTRSSTSMNGSEYSGPIPIDLIIETLSRLPTKSIARCRCVSKLWSTILCSRDFTESFLTRSSARPKLLFACEKDGEVFFFSSPQPQNPDENSSPIAVNYHMKFPCDHVYKIFSLMSGLVCIGDERVLKGRKSPLMVWEICNPSTGQSFPLPRMKTRTRKWVTSFSGYDPVEKQFKVLSMAWGYGRICDAISKEHQVLTLGGTEKLSWRMIECGISHYPKYDSVCIDGVLYYKASAYQASSGSMIICFDVRSEKFRVVNVTEPFIHGATLINYNGQLGSLVSEEHYFFGAASGSFAIFVLEDLEKQEWSKHIYELPPLWHNVLAKTFLQCDGVTGSNEIVLSGPSSATDPFYVYYYNLERKTIRRIEILGMEAFMKHKVNIFLDHVEDVKLMQAF